jgi:hypothetical protein
MYLKRAYIVPTLNLKDGILLYIPKNTEGVYTAGDEPCPLSVDEVELYEVTKLTNWHDYAEFTATKVSRNTTAQETITGSYVDDGLMLQEPENLCFCPAAHIGARVQAKEPGYDDRFLYTPYRKRDMRVAEISHIYGDGVSYSSTVNTFRITNNELELLKSFYADEFEHTPGRYDEYTVRYMPIFMNGLNIASRESRNFLPKEAFSALVKLIESEEFKKSRDIVERLLWEDRDQAGFPPIEDFRARDSRFVADISPYDRYTSEDIQVWREPFELLETTINYLEIQLGNLERISVDKLNDEERAAVNVARELIETLIEELDASELFDTPEEP